MLEERVLRRPTQCSIQMPKYSDGRQSTQSNRVKHSHGRHNALSRRSKYSDGRHDTLSNRRMTNPGQEWSCTERSKHSVGRHDAPSHSSKYSDGRQSTPSNCGNTLTAVTILYPTEASTLSADRVPSQIAEASCRPTECWIR